MYYNIHYRWTNSRLSDFIPEILDENFALVEWGRPGNNDPSAPECYFRFLSNYGAFRLNFWITNKDTKTIIAQVDLYTQGQDGTIRSKGKQGITDLQKIIQRISDSTGFTIVDIATPNAGSSHLITEDDDYNPFTFNDEVSLQLQITDFSNKRWNRLLNGVMPYPSFMRQYIPNTNLNRGNFEASEELETIKLVANS